MIIVKKNNKNQKKKIDHEKNIVDLIKMMLLYGTGKEIKIDKDEEVKQNETD